MTPLVTTFESAYDKVPQLRLYESWSKFADHLEARAAIPAHPRDKTRTECICPAVYRDGTNRAKANAELWNWFAADIDNKDGNQAHSTMAAIADRMLEQNCPFVIYTTTSSQDGAECFRLMFPLARPVEAEEFPSLWGSVSAWLGCVDERTKDISRLFFAPRLWDGASNCFVRWDEGEPLNVEWLLSTHIAPVVPQKAAQSALKAFEDITGLKDVSPSDLSLYGPFVTDQARERAQTGERGRRMFSFLVSVGTVAMMKGYAITSHDLAIIGHQLADSLGRDHSDVDHDASNAFDKARHHYATTRETRFNKLVGHSGYLARWKR